MNSEHAEEILKVDYQNNQNRRFVATRLSLGENYLNIAKEKMEFYKTLEIDGVGGFDDILSLDEVLNEYEKVINFLSETISLCEDKGSLEINNIKDLITTVQNERDSARQGLKQNGSSQGSLDEIQPIDKKSIKIDDLLLKWQKQTKKLIERSLEKVKSIILTPQHNLNIMVSYVDEGDKTSKAISMLELIFAALKISIIRHEYTTRIALKQQLNIHSHAIILATPRYQEIATSNEYEENQLKNILDQFGSSDKAKLHVLLCDGDYDNVASKIVGSQYLVRPYQAVFNEKKVWYQLDISSSLKKEDPQLKDKIIYISKESDSSLIYMVKNPDLGDPIKGVIKAEELPALAEAIKSWDVEKTDKILPDILKITSQRGHTSKECIANFQEQLPLLDFIEHLLNPLSYEYESGMLPSILDITDQKNQAVYKEYKDWFKELKQQQQMLNIQYRLKKVLLDSIKKDEETVSLIDLEKEKQEHLEQTINGIIDKLLSDQKLKSNLILCQNGADKTWVNLVLKRQLMLKENTMIVAIDCGRTYKDQTPACGVDGFLKEKLYLNLQEIEELTKQENDQVIVLFENYEMLHVYENLYIKNKLANWLKLKMLVTCDREFFQNRGYESCILPDPGFMDLNAITYNEIKSIFLQKENSSSQPGKLRRSSVVNPNTVVSYSFDEAWRKETKIARIKRYAQQAELNNFLKSINSYFKDQVDGIKNAQQIFISYAWEKAGSDEMKRKQNLLAKIAADLQTLGFFVWLDIERLACNIDQQLEKNILKSRYAFIIGTPSYTSKVYEKTYETYVFKEFKKIMKIMEEKPKNKEITVFPIEFSKPPTEGYSLVSMCEKFPEEQGALTTTIYLAKNQSDQKLIEVKYFDYNTKKWEISSKNESDFSIKKLDLNQTQEWHNEDDIKNITLICGCTHIKSFPGELLEYSEYTKNFVDFCRIDDEEEYIKQLTSPDPTEGLIPKLLGLNKPNCNPDLKKEYVKHYSQMQKQLELLPVTHLLVNKGQDDVQAYDIDGRLAVYIQPLGVKVNPNKSNDAYKKETTTNAISTELPQKLEESLNNFLNSPISTYVALGDAGSGKTLFTLWTFKKYVLQPWHNYRNKKLKIYLCAAPPEEIAIELNAIYLFLSSTKQIQYTCIVKNYKNDNSHKETQIITIDSTNTNVTIYEQIKQKLENLIDKSIPKPQEHLFTADYEKNEFFNLLKPKWLPIYIQLKNYAYPGATTGGQPRDVKDTQTPLKYIEDALLTDYNINPQDLLRLKKGLNHEQNILFILDGYDELGKSNNPNFSQALLAGYVLLCPQKPTSIQENFIYIYLNGQNVHLMFKKFTIIDQPINDQQLSKELKAKILSTQSPDNISLLDVDCLEELFKYTSKYHENDLKIHIHLIWPHAKVFITGRPEHFDNEEQHTQAFALTNNPDSYTLNYMAKFTEDDVKTYIEEYKKADYSWGEELKKLEKQKGKSIIEIINNFGLKELINNPFLLNITLQALPILIKKKDITTDITISRADLYEGFIKYWYTKEINRKEQAGSRNTVDKQASEIASCYEFAQQLVIQMFIDNTISISEKSPNSWGFFKKPANTFARETCPLRRSGNEYSFIHKSVYEYFLARYLMINSWEEIQKINGIEHGYNASIAKLLTEEPSVFSFIQDFAKPFILVNSGPHIDISKSELQKINLHGIFQTLLQWNERTLAYRLITDKPDSVEHFDDELKAIFQGLYTTEPTATLDITNQHTLAAAIDVWHVQDTKLILAPEHIHLLKNQQSIFLNLVGGVSKTLQNKCLKRIRT